MPAIVASLVFALGIAGLFFLDRDDDPRPSRALWLPVIWMIIGASRTPSQWLSGEISTAQVDLYLDGSPWDRLLLSAILAVGVVVLIARARRAGPLLRASGPLIVFFLYCAVSVLWSDYPLVSFKRWTKVLGNITMVLVVLTDPHPAAALKRVFARTGFFLIPLSVLLIKYYPALGRIYNRWTWTSSNTGVATDKNGLGAICLVFGLASLWRFVQVYRDAGAAAWRNRQLAAHGIVLAMVVWLLVKADSSTSLACFLLGGGIILLSTLPGPQRAARANAIVLTATLASLLTAVLFQDVYANFVEGLGRNTTLTGRTDLWKDLLSLDLNPWVGTGFESFWLGSRAEYFWMKYQFHPNQAHNGYLETYINLGWIGVGLLLLVVVAGYRNIIRMYERDSIAGSLSLTFLIVALVYNVTEAAFKVMHPLWIAFLFAVAAGAALSKDRSVL